MANKFLSLTQLFSRNHTRDDVSRLGRADQIVMYREDPKLRKKEDPKEVWVYVAEIWGLRNMPGNSKLRQLVLGESTSCSSRTRRVDELTRVESVKKSIRVCSSTRRV
jgi:hypothetical protein